MICTRVDDICGGNFLKYKLLYAFKSPQSHQWYWGEVEVYEHDMYAVKFHLKAYRDSKDKYKLMTRLNEARFIGANMHGESEYLTKQFRVYCRIIATRFTENVFEYF